MRLGHEKEYEQPGDGVEKAILNEERMNGEQRLREKIVQGKHSYAASSIDDNHNYLESQKIRMLDAISSYRYLILSS